MNPYSYPPYTSSLDLSQDTEIGLDLEWDMRTLNPTIMGLANREECTSFNWRGGTIDVFNGNTIKGFQEKTLIGHNIVSADIPILEEQIGYKFDPKKCIDTLILFYITNSHLCRARTEPKEKDEQTRGGGFMNLWTMASLYTDLPNWKMCREEFCEGPCPTHNVFWYNALDALAPVIAKEKLMIEARLLRVDHLLPFLSEVAYVAQKMSKKGIRVDESRIQQIEETIETKKKEIDEQLPQDVNWNSWQQIEKFFKDTYKQKPESTSIEDIESFYEAYGFPEAGLLLERKNLGKGLKSWFDKRYITDGFIYPSFQPVGVTSTGRWGSSHPNFQNIPVRSAIGKEIRKIIRAREGHLLYKCDYAQAEARAFLYQAGYEPPLDLKSWLMNEINLSPSDPGVVHLGGEWDATKSLLHAFDYGEGLILMSDAELSRTSTLRTIAAGALEVCEGWTYYGKTVCFTGVNLANRMFGSATFESRGKALRLQHKITEKFPKVRDLQKRISRQIEDEGMVRSPFGFVLRLYGDPVKMLKTGLAMMGSNPVAFYTHYAVLRASKVYQIPLAQVHDELLFEFPKPLHKAVVLPNLKEIMEFSVDEMPGFKIPVKVSVGQNWGEMEEI